MPAQGTAPQGSWIIGSATDCDLVVSQPYISGRHCRLRLHEQGFVLEDLGSTNGTFVNGQRLQPQSPVFVSRQDQITLGNDMPLPWPGEQRSSSQSGLRQQAAGQLISIGRNPESDVQLDYPMISWNHARIVRAGEEWIIEDLGSTNGTALNTIDNKVQRAPLKSTDEIYLGSFKIPAGRILAERHIAQGEGAFEVVQFRSDTMVLGRDPACDYPLNYAMISWRHALLRRTAEGISVEDLGSRNGTYVNGLRVSGKTAVRPGQEIGLGSFRFQLLEGGALAKREYTGNVTIEVNAVAVNAPNGNRLLDPVSLTIFPSELIALMGPAGAGKTTFLKALNGYTTPAGGTVLFNGSDLYRFYDRFRQQMGYVPQDDIVHPQLTVREALYFSARLRTDLTDAEIEQRIDKILMSLGIQDKKDTIIGSPERKVLSGGQRKRVNIAMELIADTPVIFLDEPTSGLSSYDAESVVRLLKKLSTEGKTIVTTIHQPSLDIFREFDSLIMISRDRGGCGALAYFGPTHPDSIEFFNQETGGGTRIAPKELSPEMLLSGLAKRTTQEWVSAYEQSKYKKLFVLDRSGKAPAVAEQSEKSAVRGIGLGQWWTLVRRNLILKVRDRAQGIILLIQAPFFALLVGVVFEAIKQPVNLADQTKWLGFTGQISGIEFLMVVAAIWFGCNNVARDIVGEWTVYQRERMISLRLPSYIFSKLAVAMVIVLFQCLMLLGIVTLICHLQGSFLVHLGVLLASSMVGSAIGLCVSACATTTEAAIAMLPLILLPVITLGGGIRAVKEMRGPVQQLAKIVPSRWAFEANLITEAQKEPHFKPPAVPNVPTQEPDIADSQFPTQTRSSLGKCFAVLGAMLIFFLSLALTFLRIRDIH